MGRGYGAARRYVVERYHASRRSRSGALVCRWADIDALTTGRVAQVGAVVDYTSENPLAR